MLIAFTAVIIIILIFVYRALYRNDKQRIMVEFTAWIIFNVILALVPILFNFTILLNSNAGIETKLLVGRGELLIGKFNGSQLAEQITQIRAFRNNYIAHQEKELVNLDLARNELRIWISG